MGRKAAETPPRLETAVASGQFPAEKGDGWGQVGHGHALAPGGFAS